MPDLFGLAQHGRDSLFADGINKLTTYSQNLGGYKRDNEGKDEDEFHAWRKTAAAKKEADRKAKEDEEAARAKGQAYNKALDDIFGDEPAKKKVKAAFVWHIMYAVFALTAVMLVGYLSKRNMAKTDSSAEEDFPMGAANNQVPRPIAPAQGQGAPGRNLDEEKYKLLADMIGSMESKPAPITFQINAAGAQGRQHEALKTLAELNIQPKPTAKPRRKAQGFVNPSLPYSTVPRLPRHHHHRFHQSQSQRFHRFHRRPR